MKIYEYNEIIDTLLGMDEDGIDEETGLVFDVTLLDKLEMDRKDKLENLLLYTAQLLADAVEIERYAAKLTTRAKSKKNKAERLKEWLTTELTRYGDKRFETARIKAAVRENSSVNVFDQNKLPLEYMRTKTETTADKTAIAAAIKAGETVAGAEIVKSKSLRIM